VSKWLARCETALTYLGVMAVIAMTCLGTVDAASRYLLNSPITGAYEITEKYLMAAAIFPGFAAAYRGGAFIRVTFFVDMLPEAVKAWTYVLAQGLSLVFCILLVYATTQQSMRVSADATTLSTLPWLLAPGYWLAPLGLGFLSLLMLIDLRRTHRGETPMFQAGEVAL
jgi:TRAP-type C4-dicarboxylate transport system permease small subunit